MALREDELKITMLGTGTSLGVPVIACDCAVCLSGDKRDKRLRSSVLIEAPGLTIVIDCGPDFRAQMLAAGVRSLDAIIFTHEHRDHTAGLDDIRGFNYILDMQIPIYATERVVGAIKQQFDYIFKEDKYAGTPQLRINVISSKPFHLESKEVIPIEVMHSTLPVLGFRIDDFTYITDASFISDSEIEKLDGVKILVLNALRDSSHFSHFSLAEAVEIIARVKPEKAFLTHMSHFIGKHAEVNAGLPDGIELAYDGLVIRI
jgi:phosphoribosyl 1,2-cyclic phosphate phosphodiesterase